MSVVLNNFMNSLLVTVAVPVLQDVIITSQLRALHRFRLSVVLNNFMNSLLVTVSVPVLQDVIITSQLRALHRFR